MPSKDQNLLRDWYLAKLRKSSVEHLLDSRATPGELIDVDNRVVRKTIEQFAVTRGIEEEWLQLDARQKQTRLLFWIGSAVCLVFAALVLFLKQY